MQEGKRFLALLTKSLYKRHMVVIAPQTADPGYDLVLSMRGDNGGSNAGIECIDRRPSNLDRGCAIN